MKRETISEAIGGIAPVYIDGAADFAVTRATRQRKLVRWGSLAACLCMMAMAAVFLLPGRENVPSDMARVTRGIGLLPFYRSKGDLLVELSEEDMFVHGDTLIFRGVVTALQNVTIDFDGVKEYRCVAQIRVVRDYRGQLGEGETVRMLLPCPIRSRISIEDSDTIEQIEVGMEGIFMPVDYKGSSRMEMNGKWFDKAALASCGLADGVRWVFLQSGERLIYDRNSYVGAEGAEDLEDIETYVMGWLE